MLLSKPSSLLLKLKTILLVSALGILVSNPSSATHLMGGNLSYESLGRNAQGYFQFKITLTVYRDCFAAGHVSFDDPAHIAVYRNDAQRNKYDEYLADLLSDTQVPLPQVNNNCNFAANLCIRKGVYEHVIALPPSTEGYHVVYERCCRNNQDNINDQQGQTYHAFIPSTNIVNSSPTFTGTPTPFICANDLTTFLSKANDPDGDDLVYSIERPHSGQNRKAPNDPYNPTLANPLESVTYKPSYSAADPFGIGGISTIDETTGLTSLKANFNGNNVALYAMAIEVKEYRNSVYLGSVRRDFQVIVLNCPPNPVPQLLGNSSQQEREVEAGTELCFPITFSDNDSIQIIGSGSIIDGSNGYNGPLATFTNSNGYKTASSTFCWTPSCNLVSATPYPFIAQVKDNGCPAKSASVRYSIIVKPFTGKLTITGDASPCQNTPNVVYSVANKTGYSYDWEVTGGTIITGGTSNKITVNWHNAATGFIKVKATNTQGCVGQTNSLLINLKPVPLKPIISGLHSPCIYTNQNYTSGIPTSLNYQWYVTGGMMNGSTTEENVNVTWIKEGPGKLNLVVTSLQGCSSDTATFNVSVSETKVDSILGSASVCPNIKEVVYEVVPTVGSNYFWKITSGAQVSGGNTNLIKVNWGNAGTGKVQVVEVNDKGCVSDTVSLIVDINYKLTTPRPLGLEKVCEHSTNTEYWVPHTNGSLYQWEIEGGTIISGKNTNLVSVDWGENGIGKLTVYETSFDSVNQLPCLGEPVSIIVDIVPLPSANSIQGPEVSCETNQPLNFISLGNNNSTYTWTINGSPDNISGQGSSSINFIPDKAGLYNISVFETSTSGCSGPTTFSSLTVNRTPMAQTILGPELICHPDLVNINYQLNGLDGSSFTWETQNAAIVSGQGTHQVSVTFNPLISSEKIKVLETSDKGCQGDTATLDLTIDNPKVAIQYVTTASQNEADIEVNWQLENADNYQADFAIYRSSVSGIWEKVGSVDQSTSSYIDRDLMTDEVSYSYIVEATNLCKLPVRSTSHSTVLLTGEKTSEYDVLMNWNNYEGWENGYVEKVISRSFSEKASFTPLAPVFEDQQTTLSTGLDGSKQCYRLVFHEDGGNNSSSYSNIICFDFKPALWVPNAFSPNDNGTNDIFLPKGGALTDYELNIYNRWGQLIFQSRQLEQGWDGTLNGKLCAEGVYLYKISFRDGSNISKSVDGTVTLLK